MQQPAAFALSLTALLGIVCWLPLRGFGQDAPQKSRPTGQETTRQDPAPSVTIEKKQKSQPGNPLQINPANEDNSASVNGAETLSQNFGDYRHTDNVSKKSASKSLPLFGYDIFRSARETVDAQRRFLRRQAIADISN